MTASSADKTAFCAERIEIGLEHLWVDGNQKITAGNGTYEDPKPNAFSLVQVDDCPGSTPTCRASCYVHGLEKHARDVHDLYRHNSATIRRILAGPARRRAAVVEAMATWISAHAKGGFRWHVSGDVFSGEYAALIRDVCLASPYVLHWIYTRSFPFASTLAEAPNLVVNLSADRDSYATARSYANVLGLRVCYMSTDGEVPEAMRDGDVLFPDYSLRGRDLDRPTEHAWWKGLSAAHRRMVCPVDFFGKSETSRCGVCTKCMVAA